MAKHIVRVELTNYLSHAHTVLDDMGMSVVIKGPNQSGKSNIYHAINMVLSNGDWPVEDLHVNKKTQVKSKSGKVKITFSDGSIIERNRTATKSSAILTYPDGRTESLGTLRGADDTIAEFTGFKMVNLFRDDAKGKGTMLQMVPLEDTTPFLLVGTSPDNILRALNRLTAGASFETAIGTASRNLAELDRDIRGPLQQDVVDLQRAVDAYDADECKVITAHLADLRAADAKLDNQRAALMRITNVVDSMLLVSDGVLDEPAMTAVDAKIEECSEAYATLTPKRTNLIRLGQIIEQYAAAVTAAESAQAAADDINTKLQAVKGLVCETCGSPLSLPV